MYLDFLITVAVILAVSIQPISGKINEIIAKVLAIIFYIPTSSL